MNRDVAARRVFMLVGRQAKARNVTVMSASLPRGARSSVIYMSYDGLLEPLGESQVVAYLEVLSDEFDVHLISFEKPTDSAQSVRVERMNGRLRDAGIKWYPQRYHKRPKVLSTVYDMTRASFVATLIALKEKARLFHARSLLSAVMLMPSLIVTQGKLIFDIRGFWTDERVEGGVVKAGSMVEWTLRKLEHVIFRRSDWIVSLTHASIKRLRDDPRFGHPTCPITVIPTCADLDLFVRGQSKTQQDPFVVGYVGQIGAWYRFDEMIELYKAFSLRIPNAHMLIVNRSQQDEVRQALHAAGVAPDRYEVVAAGRSDVPRHIQRMDVGVVLMIDAFSNFARAPTKLAEYLGCGVPCVGDPLVGDLHKILDGERVGMTMNDHSPAERDRAVDEILRLRDDPHLPARCVASARRHFALKDGVARYRSIYHSLINGAR